ncbi:MAG TPA: hypothetical protein VJ549_00665 [Geothrix sp.]|nr:hypothetical protein [Geothrix sp.]
MKSLLPLALCPALLAQSPAPAALAPDQSEMRRIEQRGREIAEYEAVSIRSTDLLLASKYDTSLLRGWVATRYQGQWVVAYGRLKNEKDPKELPDGFIFARVYACPIGKPEAMKVINISMDPLHDLDLPPGITELARAERLARATPSPWGRPWNIDLFKEPDGTITAYLLPGNADPAVRLIGGDFKMTIDASGTRELRNEPLHKSLLPQTFKGPKGESITGVTTYHTHVLTEYPTETDVAFALLNPELQGHLVMGQKWVFRIDPKGSVAYLGTPEEFLSRKP